MDSQSTLGQNGYAPQGKWYGALYPPQLPHGKWMAYVYDLNRNKVIGLGFSDTYEGAKQTLDQKVCALHAKPTNPKNFSASAAPLLLMSKAAFEYWQLAGGGAGFSHSAGSYVLWQGGRKREAQGPGYIFWQGSGDDEGLRSSDFHRCQLGN